MTIARLALLLAAVSTAAVLAPLPAAAEGAPTVSGVEVTSQAGDDATYARGETIGVTVTFSEAVVVTGTPGLSIDMDPAYWGEKRAGYASGSGTAALVFTHQVVEPNLSRRGIAVLANSLALAGGTIRSASTQADAALGHVGLAHDADHKVDWRLSPDSGTPRDTTPPRLVRGEIDGATMRLTFSEALDEGSTGGRFRVTVQRSRTSSRAFYATGDVTIDGAVVTVGLGEGNPRASAGLLTRNHALYVRRADDPTGGLRDLAGNPVRTPNVLLNDGNGWMCSERMDLVNVTAAAPVVTAPAVSGVEVTSEASADATYALGETLEVTVTFSEAVTVTGTPGLSIDMDPAAWGEKRAAYARGSGTAALVFTHKVVEPNLSRRGIAVLANSLALAGGTIRSASTQADASLTHVGLAHDANHKVDWRLADTTPPRLVRGEVDGATMTLTFSEALDPDSTGGRFMVDLSTERLTSNFDATGPVTVEGAVVTVVLGAGNPRAEAGRLTGNQVLYIRRADGEGGALRDLAGNLVAAPDVLPLGDGVEWRYVRIALDNVTVAVPAATGVEVTSQAGADATYALGETIEVAVTFSEAVNVTGTPRLKLDLGSGAGDERWAAYRSGGGTTALAFAYRVAQADASSTGVAVLANTLALNGGTVRGVGSGRDAALGHVGLAHDADHKVDWRLAPPDATAPRLSSTVVEGRKLKLGFNEAIDDDASVANGAFTVKKTPQGGSEQNVGLSGSPAIEGPEVTLTLAKAVRSTDTDVKVSYRKSATDPGNGLRDEAGNEVASFANQPVANSTPDTTPPRLSVASVDGSTLTLTFDETLAAASLSNTAFAVKKTPSGGSETAVSLGAAAPAISGKKVTLTLASPVLATDTDVKVSYTKPGSGGKLADAASNEVASFTDEPVTNITGDTTPPTLVRGEIDGGTVTLYFSEPLDPDSVGGYFRTKVRTSTRRSTEYNAKGEVAISGDVVTVEMGGDQTKAGLPRNRFWYIPSIDSTAKNLQDLAGNAVRTPVKFSTRYWSTRRITLDNVTGVSLAVTGVEVSSDAGAGATYGRDDTIRVRLTFSKVVAVTGAPRVKIDFSSATGDEKWADYARGGGTKTLEFAYTVAQGDASSAGVAVLANTLELNGGTIRSASAAGETATLAHAGLAHDPNHRVETTPPTLSMASVDGSTLTLTFDETLAAASLSNTAFAVKKTPSGGSEETVSLSGSPAISGAAVTLTLASAVAADDGAIKVSYTKPGSGGKLADAAGNEVASFADREVTNATAPSVTEVEVTSQAGDDATYVAGDTVEVRVTFDDAVTVDTTGGTPRLKLGLGGDPAGGRWAGYVSGSSTAALVFRYWVGAGDASSAGIAVLANTLEANGGTLRSAAGADVALAHAGLAHDPAHKVDSTPLPTLSVASVNGATLTLIFDKPLGAAASLVNGAFTVKKTPQGGTEERVSLSGSPSIDGATVILSLANAVLETDTDVKVSYTRPTSGTGNRLRNESGREVASFTDEPVTNIAGDTTPPRLERGEVDGGTITLYFSEALDPDSTGGYFWVALYYPRCDSIFGSCGLVTSVTGPVQVSGKKVMVGMQSSWGPLRASSVGQPGGHFLYRKPTSPLLSFNPTPGVKGLRDLAGNEVGDTRQMIELSNLTGPPRVTGVAVSSDAGADRTYARGETVRVRLTFSEAVDVTGPPRLKIDFSSGAGGERWADYASGSGKKTLEFAYTVAQGDASSAGVAVPANTLELAGGTIRSASAPGENAGLAHAGLAHDPNHKVDGTPSVSGVLLSSDAGDDAAYGLGETIGVRLTFNEAVAVTGTPRVKIDFSSGTGDEKWAAYASGSGTKMLEFAYTVAQGDASSAGVAVLANTLALNGGTIRSSSSAGDNAKLAHAGLGHDPNHKVDSAPPTLSAAAVDGATLTLTFSETLGAAASLANGAFTVKKTPQGGTEENVSLSGTPAIAGATVTLTLANAVLSADTGVKVGYTKPTTAGAGNRLRDEAGNEVASFTDQPVTNGTKASVSGVKVSSEAGDDATYVLGETVRVTLTFSEAVNVTGAPQVKIDFSSGAGGERRAVYASGSGTTTLEFAYTVVARDFSTQGVAVLEDTLVLDGGTIRSAASGKDAALAHPGRAHDPAHKVDGTPPPTLSVASVDGSTLTLTFNETLAAASLSNTAFAVKKTPSGGSETAVSLGAAAPAISAKKVTLTLASAVLATDTDVKVSYTKPGSGGKLADAAGNEVASFTDEPVTNIAGDTTPPTLVRGEIDGGTMTLYFNEPLDPDSTGGRFRLQVMYAFNVVTNFYAAGEVAIRGNKVTIGLGDGNPHAIAGGFNNNFWGYSTPTDPTARGLRDLAGNEVRNTRIISLDNVTGPPRVTGVDVSSEAGGDATYGLGDTIRIRLTFDKAVSVTGAPRLKIDFSSGTGDEKWAAYASGGGTKTLEFAYTVAQGDASSAGIAVLANTLELDGGTIESTLTTGENAALAHAGLPHNAAHKVDGRPVLSVADAQANEGAGASVSFQVSLSRAAAGAVTVDYATADGTATAGADYTATSGTLTFAAGDTAKTVSVPVLDDAIDEGEETFSFRLSNATGARIADGEATGTITNADPLQKMWLSRFGRTVASHVTDAVSDRLSGPLTGAELSVGGQRVDLARTKDEAWLGQTLTSLARALGAREGPEPEGGGGPGTSLGVRASPAASRAPAREISGRELLLGSAFHLGAGGEGGGPGLAAWGRVTVGGFDGEAPADGGTVRIDGEVTTGILGADAEWDRLLAGVAVSVSEGEGTFDQPGVDSGTIESTMTAVSPYARLSLNDRLSAWGLLGYGTGDMTIVQAANERGQPERVSRSDLAMRLAALGGRGALMEADESGGMDLGLKADAFFVETEAEAVSNEGGTTADASRLRLILEGSRAFGLGGGVVLTPGLELGLRHDGGDAETGTGVELGGRIAWSDPGTGLGMEARVRTLLAHEDSDYREWGASGSLRLDPGASGRGLSFHLAPTWGAASSGAERLWSARDAGGLARGAEFEPERRLEGELGYGLALFGGRFTGTPHLGFGLSDRAREYRIGWRLTPAIEGDPGFEVSLDATRRESAHDHGTGVGAGSGSGAGPEHGVMLRGALRW